MTGDFAEIARRVLASGPADPADDPEALAGLLRSDLPYPLGEVLWLQRRPSENGPSSASATLVFFTSLDDGHSRPAVAPLGAFLVMALTATMREAGSSDRTRALLAQAHQRAAAERETEGDVEDTLASWAVGSMLHDRGAARLRRLTVTGARP